MYTHEWTETNCTTLGQLNKIRNGIYKFILDFNRIMKNASEDGNKF